jgi:hypothetical protein
MNNKRSQQWLCFFLRDKKMGTIQRAEYQVSDIQYESRGFIDVIKDGRKFRFKVADDGGAGSALTQAKAREIISNLVTSEPLTLAKFANNKSITVEKNRCQIEGLHAPIVLKMTHVSPILNRILKLLRKFILEPIFGTRSSLVKHITIEFRFLLEHLPDRIQRKVLHDLRITAAEHYSLQYFGALIKNYSPQDKVKFVQEVLHGAYVQIEDGGSFYNEWVKEVPHKETRHSSHESSDAQYSFQGPLFNECLFSKKKVVNEKGEEREVTWFQLEKYPMGKAYLLPHLITWAIYKATGQNQGPHGASDYTEKNPYVLDVKAR